MAEIWLNWQINFLLLLQNLRETTNHSFDNFFLNITKLGEIMIIGLVICLIFWCINKKSGIYILFSFWYGFTINFALKITACIYRPWLLSPKIHPLNSALKAAGGYSFPSGHSINSTTVFGGSVIEFWHNKFVRIFALLIIPIVMFSRLFVGVHTPQDVVVGLVEGIIVLYLVHILLKWEEKKKNRDLIILLTTIGTLILLFLYTCFKSYPTTYVIPGMQNELYLLGRIGLMFGVFIGWFIEKRFINFEIKNGFITKLKRYIIGIIPLSLLYIYSKSILVQFFGSNIGSFIYFFIIGSFITAMYPYLIKAFKI